MDNLEKLATLGTQDTGQVNVRENGRGNQEWTIQRNCKHLAHKTQDTRQTKQKIQHNICWTPLYANILKRNANKT